MQLGRSIVCLGAHPDDAEIGCGGTLAKAARDGARLTIVCLTSGENGSDSLPPAKMGPLRETEAKRAGALLGADNVQFMRFGDGLTTVNFDMKLRLIALLRELKPDTVFVHTSYDAAPDHKTFHALALDAVFSASGPWFQAAGPAKAHAVPQILGFEVWSPMPRYQCAIDITETLPVKLAALREHSSQISGVPYERAAEGLAAYRGAMTMVGRYAEVFEIIRA